MTPARMTRARVSFVLGVNIGPRQKPAGPGKASGFNMGKPLLTPFPSLPFVSRADATPSPFVAIPTPSPSPGTVARRVATFGSCLPSLPLTWHGHGRSPGLVITPGKGLTYPCPPYPYPLHRARKPAKRAKRAFTPGNATRRGKLLYVSATSPTPLHPPFFRDRFHPIPLSLKFLFSKNFLLHPISCL